MMIDPRIDLGEDIKMGRGRMSTVGDPIWHVGKAITDR